VPGRDGLGLLAELWQVAPGLPVVLITAYPTPTVRQQATLLGASGFLLKPVTLATLRQASWTALRP
jgi:DNA-binding NarL/FixJ family response regulator